MKALLGGVMALLLAACVTVRPDGELGAEPNLREAARANTQLATEYTRSGNYDVALEKAQKAIAQDNSYAPAHAAIALLYARRGEDSDAISHYRKAIALDPRDPNIRNNFAIFQCEHGRTDEALQLFASVARDRDYSTPEAALTNAGVCANRAGQPQRAEGYFRDALTVNPNFAEALLQMAALSAQQQDWLRVRAFIQRRDRLSPPSADSLRLAIQAEKALGDTATADRLGRQLQQDFP